MGDIIGILKHAKKVHAQVQYYTVRERYKKWTVDAEGELDSLHHFVVGRLVALFPGFPEFSCCFFFFMKSEKAEKAGKPGNEARFVVHLVGSHYCVLLSDQSLIEYMKQELKPADLYFRRPEKRSTPPLVVTSQLWGPPALHIPLLQYLPPAQLRGLRHHSLLLVIFSSQRNRPVAWGIAPQYL